MGEMETRSLLSHVQDANSPEQECKAVLQHEEWQELPVAGRKCALMWEDPCPPHQGGCDQYHLIVMSWHCFLFLMVQSNVWMVDYVGLCKKIFGWISGTRFGLFVHRRPKAQLTSGLAPLGHGSTLPSIVLPADWDRTRDVPSSLCLGPCLPIKMYFGIRPNSCLYLSIYVGKSEK